ncbi:GNAT family N-acetyltransferase [Paenibacillus sp. YPG26]|uniref:GNAT family N-acetyltransferase n=1 Tax=Paenibacillus sp. YPG26 TaxID=2878915 RepID=UPI00203BE020|nr:GNAT family N-acetyltransferase [Paenibacillus sp. YPG26]USB32677.1 GNAT family N-acetyltransferase [Paenibacillus sp. YPG26]
MEIGTQVRQVSPPDENLAALILKLDEYLITKYPPEEIFKVDFSDPSIQKGYFVVAYEDGTPVGCGGFLPYPEEGFAELKRFFVDPAHRNKGIARQLLTHLEEEAGKRGFRTIRLETGEPQVEAVSFYTKHEYMVIERYGEYANCESSLCMEKQIGR